MIGLGWQEIFVIGLVCIIVVGPSHLPQAIRTVAVIIRRLRGFSDSVRYEISRLGIDSSLEEIASDIDKNRSIVEKGLMEGQNNILEDAPPPPLQGKKEK